MLGNNTKRFHKIRADALSECGKILVGEEVPKVFAQSGPGWPGLRHRSGKPLVDTGKLARSVKWGLMNNQKTLYVYSQEPHAITHQLGAGGDQVAWGGELRIDAKSKYTNVPGGPYVHVPFAEELSDAQRRRFRPFTDFPGARIFRGKSGWIIAAPEWVGRRVWIAIAALRKFVMVPARPFLVLTDATLGRFGKIWQDAITAAMR